MKNHACRIGRHNGIGNFLSRTTYQDRVAIGIIIGALAFWTLILVTRGKLLDSYIFCYLTHQWGTDYFNVIYNFENPINPWENGLNYPAGICLLFRLAFHMVPLGTQAEYADAYAGATYTYAALGLVIMYFISAVAIWIGTYKMASGKLASRLLLAWAVFLTGPIFAAFFYANSILLSFGFLFIFVGFYSSDRTWLRWLAYASLGVAATIKIYPAVFLMMLLADKKLRREFIPACILVALFVIVPFFFFEGITSIKSFLSNFSSESSWKSDWGFGYLVGFQTLVKIISYAVGSYIEGDVPRLVTLIPFAVFFFLFFTSEAEWKRLFACALLCIWYPFISHTYVMLLFFPALCSLVRSCDKARVRSDGSKRGMFYTVSTVLMLLLIVPWALPQIDSVNEFFLGLQQMHPEEIIAIYPFSWTFVLLHTVTVSLVLLIAIDNVRRIVLSRSPCGAHLAPHQGEA